jgi:vancomycin resistance protein VanJ
VLRRKSPAQKNDSTPAPPGEVAAVPARHRGWNRLLTTFNVLYALLAISAWFILRYAADRWWPATVLLFAPRWPALLPLLLLLPLSLRRGKRQWVLPLVTGLFVLGPLMDLHVPWRQIRLHEPAGMKLEVLTCNVHRTELDRDALDSYVRQTNPQVVLLQDYSDRDALPSLQRPGWHRYRLAELFIASAFPIIRVRDLHLEEITGNDDLQIPRHTGAAACFDLQTPAGVVHVVNLHLPSPHLGLGAIKDQRDDASWLLQTNSIRRWKDSERITSRMAAEAGPTIIAGDFNTLAESPIFRRFWSGFSDAFPTAGFGYGYTYYTRRGELRIDHVLSGAGVVCTNCRIGPPCGSPHRPVLAELVIQKPN